MRHYEIMIILDPSQDERTVAPSLDKYLEIVRKDNGKVEKVDVWGKRRLAYPINKKEEGVYAVVNVECESATVLEVDRVLSLNLLAAAAKKRETMQTVAAKGAEFTIIAEDGESDAQVEELIRARADAKKAKNFAEADRIRDELKAQGIEIIDVAGGAQWKKI